MPQIPTENIINAIKYQEGYLRNKYPTLKYQNTIGLVILLISFTSMIASGYLYYMGQISALLCIFIAALSASIAHEIEHDLIHKLYFRDNLVIHNLMLLIVWVMRPNTVNPWYRRKIHLLHHRKSGTPQDLEERLVGNGISNLFIRFVVMFDSLLGLIIQREKLKNQVDNFSFVRVFNAGFPLATLYYATWYAFILIHLIEFIYLDFIIPQRFESYLTFLDFIVVVLIGPNFIRAACLNIVTSYLHYYQGVNHLIEQTQVLKGYFMWPFNLFTVNFAGTHSIHHFVVHQPFYMRQLVAKTAHHAMKENGVRFNDFHSFLHANKYINQSKSKK